MTDLSPAARAVLEAAMNVPSHMPYECYIAATLRAAASQAEGLLWDEDARFGDGVMATSNFIENIAAELEVQP